MIEGCTIVFDTIGTIIPFPEQGYYLRHGTRELFKQYQAAGNSVFVTSSESTGFVQSVVRHAQLEEVVKAGITVSAGKARGKAYGSIVETQGYTPEQAMRKLIITGDSLGDVPIDLDRIILLLHYNGNEYDAQVHRITTEQLWDIGKGNFYHGFEQMRGSEALNPQRVRADIGHGIKLILSRSTKETQQYVHISNPIVEIIADQYKWRRLS